MTAPNIIETMADEGLFGASFRGASWSAWRAVLKAAFAIPMTPAEIEIFRSLAERDPPGRRVRELWAIAGRRSGKDSIASVIAAHLAALADCGPHLRPGERALVMCLACDREQARIVLNYTRAYFDEQPLLGALVKRRTVNGMELNNGVDVAIATNSFRAVRGRPILAAILDEVAFYADERSAAPDIETYRAVLPGLATLPGAILIGISSPYRKAGLLFEKYREHYGRDGDVLVIKAPSLALNPTLDGRIIDDALEVDPEAARAEWLGEFRNDVAAFVDRAVVESAIVPGCHELPFVEGHDYVAFTDPSGGSADSFTLAIAHSAEGGKRVLDLVREVRPPFSPDAVVKEFAATLKAYHLSEVTGDRYAGEWLRERFREHGIEYCPSERSKSEIYLELLPLLNSGSVALLDNKRLIVQFCSLERRTARGGKDSIDHSPSASARDDVGNSAAGALVLAAAAEEGVCDFDYATLAVLETPELEGHGGKFFTYERSHL